MPRLVRLSLAVAALASSGCQLEKLYPDQVAIGVARLTVRNAGTLVSLVQADTRCGFSSRAVLDKAVVTGEWGTPGSVELTVDGCTLDFGEATVVSKDCAGVETQVSGRVTVSGKVKVLGTVSRNPDAPVIPDAADAVRFDLSATFDDFVVREVGKKPALTIKSGSLQFAAQPHLAASASTGLCSIPTRALALTGVTYGKASVFVESADRQFPAEVDSSSFSAQAGKWGEQENSLEGQLSVWGSQQALPTKWDAKGLDPEYDARAFESTYACAEDLAQPVSYQCTPLREVEVQAAARLSVANLGTLGVYVDDDTSCGFASPAVVKAARVTGTVGKRGGSATFSITTPCRLHFAAPTLAKKDCNGLSRFFSGTVSVTGTKVVRGIPTGDPKQPIVPTSRQPANASLTLRFEGFELSDSANGPVLRIDSGALTGTVTPRLAIDTQTGACSLKTPAANFAKLAWEGASVVLKVDGHQLPFQLKTSSLDAINGTLGDKTNYLGGSVTLDDAGPISIPVRSGSPTLQPGYDEAAFESAFTCEPHLKIARTEEDCSFYSVLAEGAARLLVQNTGAVASAVNADSGCGFNNLLVQVTPDDVQGKAGEMGSMTWSVKGCGVGGTSPTAGQTDCTGTTPWTVGRATSDTTRVVTGLREKKLLGTFVDSIIPASPDAVTLKVANAKLEGFSAYSVKKGATKPEASLIVHAGTLSATVRPILGERKSAPGTFDVQTPVAELTQVKLTNADVTLHNGDMQFRFNIPSATVEAFNGTRGAKSNSISGSITVDDHPLTLAPGPLNPAFEQAAFDQSYACTSDLKAVIK